MSSNTNPLADLIESTLADNKAQDVTNLDVKGIATFTDNMIIATGTSNRHTRALADYCIEAAKKADYQVLSRQGEVEGEWVLVDFGSVILHVMQPKTRDFYQLEKFWSLDDSQMAESH